MEKYIKANEAWDEIEENEFEIEPPKQDSKEEIKSNPIVRWFEKNKK